MARHVISVCIFCFICATHTPCASHGAMEPPLLAPRGAASSGEALKLATNRVRFKEEAVVKRAAPAPPPGGELSAAFVRRIFQQFGGSGGGESMTMEEFGRMVEMLDLGEAFMKAGDGTKGNDTATKPCVDGATLRTLIKNDYDEDDASSAPTSIDGDGLLRTCPALLYSLVSSTCSHNHHHHHHHHVPAPSGYVWFYSILAVILISACGLLALVIIPLMQKRFYKPLIQFLVALAVGTLAGDALLHLLPHAMTPPHEEGGAGGGHQHDENMWKGFVAMMGLTFFFVMERVILVIGKWRKRRQKKVAHSHVRVVNETCMDKYNSIPYCFQDIIQDTKKYHEGEEAPPPSTRAENGGDAAHRSGTVQCSSDNPICSESNRMLPPSGGGGVAKLDDHQMVIIREHETAHHGHSHAHGHVHAAPQNFSAVAWMVIMGDGLHNFTDGMAIGAAFSAGLAGGFSTTVAVFCHELPHELGDFAMLLKAGMTIRQAVFYNLLSSGLCVLGNCFGVWLGNTESASAWVFAAAAGMFLYIALVDMIPELSSAHEDEGNVAQCFLHLGGLVAGVAVMTLIAFYEHDLKHIFKEGD